MLLARLASKMQAQGDVLVLLAAESRRNIPSGKPGLCVYYRACFGVGQDQTRHTHLGLRFTFFLFSLLLLSQSIVVLFESTPIASTDQYTCILQRSCA
jgi:hypothetical protein